MAKDWLAPSMNDIEQIESAPWLGYIPDQERQEYGSRNVKLTYHLFNSNNWMLTKTMICLILTVI